jgi:hypothetical protein
MMTYGGVDVQTHVSLTSALAGGEWSASSPDRFTPRGKRPLYPLDRRLGERQSQSGLELRTLGRPAHSQSL